MTFTNHKRLGRESLDLAEVAACQYGARLGFRPAYYDYSTCTTYLSRFADGSPAPVHLLDGLPEHLVAVREPGGRVLAVRPSLIAGFERNGFFYTRINAARLVAQCGRVR